MGGRGIIGRAGYIALLATSYPSICLAVPPQIVPEIGELGTPSFSFPGSTSSQSSTSASSSSGYSGAWGTGDAYSTMLSQSYGAAALAAAQAQGINPDTLAAFGQIESHFSNVGNSSSSASGVWQVTDGTWNEYASKLGLTGADRSDPAVQAKVASAIIDDYASSVSQVTGTPATGTQVYGAYMFGTKAGAEIAAATDSQTPLSQFVSSNALAANNMTGWTVGQYYSTVAQRMGSGASEAVTNG